MIEKLSNSEFCYSFCFKIHYYQKWTKIGMPRLRSHPEIGFQATYFHKESELEITIDDNDINIL